MRVRHLRVGRHDPKGNTGANPGQSRCGNFQMETAKSLKAVNAFGKVRLKNVSKHIRAGYEKLTTRAWRRLRSDSGMSPNTCLSILFQ